MDILFNIDVFSMGDKKTTCELILLQVVEFYFF